MPTPISQMIQTIVALRDLQLREAAQQLTARQLGISEDSSHSENISRFQNLIQGVADPSSLLPYTDQFTRQTGLTPEAVRALITRTPPAAATTTSSALASGAAQLGGSQDVAAATRTLTGMTPGEAATDRLRSDMFGAAGQHYQTLPQEQRDQLSQDIIQGAASGQDVGSAAISHITKDFVDRQPQGVRDFIVKVGKGLAPSAEQDAQLQLGWAGFRAQTRYQESQIAMETLRTNAAIAEAQTKLSGKAFDDANNLLTHRDAALQTYLKNSATMTDVGRKTAAQTINSYNEQLRRIAPAIFGPQGTVPLSDFGVSDTSGETPGATGVAPFLSQYLKNKLSTH